MFDAVVNIVTLLAILLVIVLVHELGHFLVAKRRGVTVHEFGIGFPPRARVIGYWGETEITLNYLPLGGFVRLEGEDGDSDDPRSFARQGLVSKLTIIYAGVVMNFVLAIILFASVALMGDPTTELRFGATVPDAAGHSPAAAAGLVAGALGADGHVDASGDSVVMVDGQRFFRLDPSSSMLDYLAERAGTTVVLTVRHADGRLEDIPVALREPAAAAAYGALGVTALSLVEAGSVERSLFEAVVIGAQRTLGSISTAASELAGFAADLAHPAVAGPVGMVPIVGSVRTESSPLVLIGLVALLSVSVGFMNALPIPPLDGGRGLMIVLRALAGRRWNAAFEGRVYKYGFMGLLVFIAYVTFHDLLRIGG